VTSARPGIVLPFSLALFLHGGIFLSLSFSSKAHINFNSGETAAPLDLLATIPAPPPPPEKAEPEIQPIEKLPQPQPEPEPEHNPDPDPESLPQLQPALEKKELAAQIPKPSKEARGDLGQQGVTQQKAHISFRKPSYPWACRRKNQEGNVILEVQVRSDGSIGSIHLLSSSGHPLLDRAAIKALGRRGVTAQPATVLGQPINSTVKLELEFLLKDLHINRD
jgi:periplasmic protein TonB